jgi:IclR family transcriptional regulator, acetate operon repressor
MNYILIKETDMAGSLLDRALGALEFLARSDDGAALQAVADTLSMPKSGAHRLLGDLIRRGYVQQDKTNGQYRLTTRLLSVAFRHLAATGIVDIAQPLIDQLARKSGELVRLSVTDGDRQVWVAKAQGARSGLIIDAQMGDAAQLSCMATGHAWLACLSDEEALRLVTAQGFGDSAAFGPNAPRTIADLLEKLERARALGYAAVVDSSAPGTSALAAAIRHPQTGAVLGTVSVGGPSVRLTLQRIEALAPSVMATAGELAACRAGSSLLVSRVPGAASG